MGRNAVKTLLQSGLIKELITGSSILGLFMIGALSASTVKVQIPIEVMMSGNIVTIQSIIDGILPGILPLGVVMSIYWYLKTKEQNFGKLVFIILAFCMLGSLIGLL
ncbi:Mannose permease IID component [compost metagenome]